ncbi:MAG: histidinol dehydrogenase [Alphaproteobacteria bacterium]|nr:histidinol dehydrogenase [Alphaproteobacteria bacterium]
MRGRRPGCNASGKPCTVHKLSTASGRFPEEFGAFLHARAASAADVSAVVTPILRRVHREGDAALLAYTRQFDRWEAALETLRVTPQEVANALALCAPELTKSLKVAASRIRAYSERQMPADAQYTDAEGLTLGWRWTPVDAVGLYVPGGAAAYPSSVLMNAVPALVAGVRRIAMVVPAPDGQLNPSVLAAAHVAGIQEIYKIGGAQAVGALAYGTETIAAADKIVGPGNAYVSEAKRQVFGTVGIDMIAGPSEILVVADRETNPEWIAADLLSQAEHGPADEAQSILITNDAPFAEKVAQAVERLLQTLPRAAIARASWERHGAIIVVRDWQEAVPLIDAIAPEHLELALEAPEALAAAVRHAGAIFMGRHTPEAVGDYVAGPSHVLPTFRSARFSSGLSVFDFLKRSSLIGCTPQSLAAIGMYAEVMATQEGLEAHALSLRLRTK